MDGEAEPLDLEDQSEVGRRTQYGATRSNPEQRKSLRYAGFATLGKPLQRVNYHS